ncbi:hypothetical protein GCM10023320_11670 [Pseudonocardia adelaidensis]|uniref:Uncharacterized protein n=1 Tax=Pseudonocardia adelaidensis TaxID=648754 RepID=A0ABP9NCC6_9PSEU
MYVRLVKYDTNKVCAQYRVEKGISYWLALADIFGGSNSDSDRAQ